MAVGGRFYEAAVTPDVALTPGADELGSVREIELCAEHLSRVCWAVASAQACGGRGRGVVIT